MQSLIDHGSLTAGDDAEADAAGGRAAPRLRLTQPIAELAIPPTVQALLAARLDRLPERDKLVLQAAAVIGRASRRRCCATSWPARAAAPAPLRGCQPRPSTHRWRRWRGPISSAATRRLGSGVRLQAPAHPGGRLRHPSSPRRAPDCTSRVAHALQTLHADRLGQYAALLAHHFAAADWKFEARRWRRRATLRVTNIELGRQQRR